MTVLQTTRGSVRIRARRVFVLGTLLANLSLTAPRALALDPNLRISQYAHTAWRLRDGTFPGTPTAITQTTDGYMWIGTLAGLLRFDGVRFVPFIPPAAQHLPNRAEISLLGATEGSLWIGTASGLARWKSGELFTFQEITGRVNSTFEDRDGMIWIGRSRTHAGAVCRLAASVATCFAPKDGVPPYANVLIDDNLGFFLIGTSTGIPRSYRFRVKACNNSGLWNEADAVVDFAIAPAFYQTLWFRSLGVLLFLAVLAVLYRLRFGHLERQRDAFRKSEKDLRDVIDTIPAIVWSTLPDGSNAYLNRRFIEYSGLSAEQTTESGWKARVHPDDLERQVSKWMDAIDTGKPLESEVRLRCSDGQYRWQLDRGVPLRDEDGNIIRWYGVVTDIEDRKRAEEGLQALSRDLQENKAKLEEAQRITHVGYWEWDLITNGVIWSDETYRIYGMQPQECPMDLATVRERIHPEDWQIVSRALEEALRGGARYKAECRVFRLTGEVRIVCSQGDVKTDASGRPVLMFGTVQDITDHKRAEQEREKLRQLEADLAHVNRVSTLGEMAASLAHEIKQPIAAAITSANSCVEWLSHEPPNLDRARAAAARIDKYGNHAAEIIDRIRSLYKKCPPQRELVDVNGIIHEMLTLLTCEADLYLVSMRTDLSAELPQIVADRVQLQQVFMNLMINAIEAMKDAGGELTVKSELQEGQLQFSVGDTGVGLPMEKMDQIFTIFFTTKPEGSGMGLAISRSIVESHDGRMWASANDGRGATFHFSLPITTHIVQETAAGA